MEIELTEDDAYSGEPVPLWFEQEGEGYAGSYSGMNAYRLWIQRMKNRGYS